MNDKRPTRSELLQEVETLRRRVTELEQAQQLVTELPPDTNLTLENMLEGCQIIGFDWRYLYLNAAAIRHSLQSKETLLGRTMMECYPGIDQTAVFATLRDCMEQRVAHQILNEFVYPDGSRAWFELSVQPVPQGIFVLSMDVTERQQASEALRASGAQYRLLADHMTDTVWLMDMDLRFIYISPSVTRLRGYTLDELNALPLDRQMPPDSFDRAMGHFRRIVAQEEKAPGSIPKSLQIDLEFYRKDGSTYWSDNNFSLIRDEQGQVVNILGTGRDVTDRKRAEEARRESEMRYANIFHASPIGIVVTRLSDGKITEINEASLVMLGYTREEMLGHSTLELGIWAYAEDRDRIVTLLREQGRFRDLELTFRKRSGELGTMLVSTEILTIEGSSLMVSQIQDITERKQASEALRKSEAFLNSIIQHSPFAMWIADAQGTMILQNQACRDLLHITDEEVVGKYNALQDPIVAAQGYLPLVKRVFEQGERAHFTLVYETVHLANLNLKSQVSVILEVTISPVVDDQGRVINAIIQHIDITERERAEQTLRLFIEHAPAAIAMFDRNMHYIAVSRRWMTDYRVQDENIVGRLHYDVFPELSENFRQVHQRGLKGAVEKSEGDPFPRLDGTIDWVRWEVHPWREPDGEIGGIILFSEVITERRLAEDALRASEAQYRLLADHMADVIWILDPTTRRFTYISPSVERLRGYTPNDVLEQAMDESITPVCHATLSRTLQEQTQAFLAGNLAAATRRTELEQIRRDGSTVCTEVVTTPFYDEQGALKILGVSRDISERKQMEMAVRLSEERFSKAFRANPTAMSISRFASGVIIDVNESYHRIMGYSADDVVGHTTLELNIYENSADRETVIQHVKQHGRIHNFECRLRTKSGDLRDVLLYIEQIQLENEDCVIASLFDISERKRAESARRESEERYTRLFENMLNGFAYCRMEFEEGRPKDFIYLAVNQAFETLTGLKGAVGKYVTELIPDIRETDPELFEIYGRVVQTGQPEQFETYVTGLAMWFSTSVYRPIPGHFVAVFDVITERKRAEEEIRSLARFPSENPNPVLRLRPDGLILYANEASALILEKWGTAENHYAPVYWQSMAADAHHRQTRTTVEVQYGERVWSIVITPVPEGSYINFYGRDISGIRRAEAEILKLNSELERRVIQRTAELDNANKELEAFAYSVSHDLRAPLRAMDGFSRILMEDFSEGLDSTAQRYLRLVRENAQQMGELIDHLLAFSRLGRQAMKTEPTHMGDVVQRALDELSAVREGRDIHIEIGDLPDCEVDPVLLRQVYVNLLGNALKFTREREHPAIEVGSQNQEGQTIFFVRDNGVGFDMRYADKLFGVFQRLHRIDEYEGTGVGLATVQRIIHRHGGRIWAEAEVGRGAAFFFTLGGTHSHDG